MCLLNDRKKSPFSTIQTSNWLVYKEKLTVTKKTFWQNKDKRWYNKEKYIWQRYITNRTYLNLAANNKINIQYNKYR